MKVWSWNVNGLRAVARKGFGDWLNGQDAAIVGVQEVRAEAEQLPAEVCSPEGWWSHFVAAERKGYSGVAAYARAAADAVETGLGEARFDVEGRFQWLRWGRLHVVNAYFPNGSGSKFRDNSRIPYKLDFYRRVFDVLEPHRAAGEPILVLGDFNTAHRPVDLARPRENAKTSGFTLAERRELGRWLRNGWTDTFRHFHPKKEGAYSWWSQRFGVRAKNVGWRIDYVLASPGAMEFVGEAFIAPEVTGSDHCPVGVEIDEAVMG